MTTNSAVVRVGRLLEVRAEAGYRNVSDVDTMFDSLDLELAKVPRSRKIVTVADWRRCPVMEGKASERLLQRIMVLNPRTERSATIATATAPVAIMQFMRLIRESRLEDRKIFLDPQDLIRWLDEVLDPAEQQRLRVFLAA
jgi:hypothetical protein